MSKYLFTKRSGLRFLCFFFLAILMFGQYSQMASALAPSQRKLFQSGINYFDLTACPTSPSGGGATVSADGQTTGPPKAVQQVVWNTLTAGGIDAIHTAAVMGNISIEGVWNPESTEIAGPTGGKPSKDPASTGDYGYGLIGWTPGASDTKTSALTYQMKELGLSSDPPWTAETQAAVILGDIQGKTAAYPASKGRDFLATKTVEDATKFYEGDASGAGFENPADPGASQQDRVNAAQKFWRQYGGTTGSAPAAASTAPGGGACCPSSGSVSPAGSTTLTGKTNAEKIFNYLEDNEGLTDNQAAGAVGSMMLESGGNTLNIDPTATNPGSGAYGIAQWTPSGGRLAALEKFATKQGTDKSDLLTQIQYLMQEMNSNINGYNNDDFKKQKTLHDAIVYWTDYFEGLLYSPSQQLFPDRTNNADTLLKSVNGGDGVTGSPTAAAPATAPATCTCPASAPVDGKTVVIDPGHGPAQTTVDQATGLTMIESDNQPEGHDVWEVANKVKDDLSKQGYNIILTKKSEDDNVTFRQRAQVADDNHAALALSIHGDATLANPGEIYVQKVGLFRGSGSDKTVFSDADVAQKSQQYAQTFKEERQKSQSENVVIKDNSYNGRGLEPGDLAMVQLFSKTPWVYNEQQMPFDQDKYAEGLENSIKSVLGASDAGGGGVATTPSGCTTGAVSGDLASTVQSYAWPTYSSGQLDPEPAYKTALDKAAGEGQYIGDGYTDCGAFVTRVMIDSGYEPGYNFSGKLSDGAGPTYGGQIDWLKANWQKLNVSTTKDLQPGDVAISDKHTYLYMGSEGFKGYDSVSASDGSRTPMASAAYDLSSFNWYRKK